jgi:ribosomal protein L11 methyltransferase
MNTRWLELTIHATTTATLYSLADHLMGSGYESLEIQDGEEWTEHSAGLPPELMDDDVREGFAGLCRVKLYFPDTPPGREDAALCRVCIAAYSPALAVTEESRGEEGWLDNWKQYYLPTPIGKRLLVQPEWLPVENPENRTVYLSNPGVCFGTGTHATTRLCLALLEETVRGGESLLDIGCGSGILAVCGLLLGAESAAAVDVDPLAVDITRENAARNGIGPERLRAYCLDVCKKPIPGTPYDLITANLTTDIIRVVLPFLPGLLIPGGRVVFSGILGSRVEEIARDIAAAGFTVTGKREEDGWSAMLCHT